MTETNDNSPDRGSINLRAKRGKFNLFLFLIPIGFVLLTVSFLIVSQLNRSNSAGENPLKPELAINTPEDRTEKASLASNQDEIRRQILASREREKKREEPSPNPKPAMPTPNVPQTTNNGEPVLTPYQRKQQGGVLLVFQNGQPSNNQNNTQNSANTTDNSDLGISNGSSSSLDTELSGTTFSNGYARVRRNIDFLLIHGTNIPCVLKTKVVTEYKSLLLCQVPKDVYSANGKVLLIEKGSMVTGEQRTAMLRGNARVFVAWTTVETPHKVSIQIDSLGTDTLGASGHEAWVDGHFKERFGGAILLSFLDFAFQYAENKANDNNSDNGVTFNNSSRDASDLAGKALDNTINIPDTGYINQGSLLNILVARDVDFRNIYTMRYQE